MKPAFYLLAAALWALGVYAVLQWGLSPPAQPDAQAHPSPCRVTPEDFRL